MQNLEIQKKGISKFIFCFEQSVAKMQNKVVLRFDFAANNVLTVWFCCNMSGSLLDIFSGANDVRALTTFLRLGRHFRVD